MSEARPGLWRHAGAAYAAALLLLVAGCSGGDGDGVRAFADIQAGPIELTFDATAVTATLEVDTTIAAVCAVAYGSTADLGQLATDSDMEAGAHGDHRPVLTGLQPDTDYFYRLQGVGEDGILYQSELMTFRTSAADPAADPGENAAVGAVVLEVSSEFSAAFAAENAVDGDPSTEWSSRGDGDDAYLVIDLGRTVEATAVGFDTREMSDGTATTTSFTITVDGAETYGPFPAGPGLSVAEVAFAGRVVRFDVATSTGGNTGAVEVAVYTSDRGG